MTNRVATEIGDNWAVFFFIVPAKMLKRILIELFEYVREIEEVEIPHFMMREYIVTQHVGISFRLLRNQEYAEIVDSKLIKFFESKNMNYQSNPKGNRHAWKPDSKTNRAFCEALHQLSNLVVFLAQNNMFGTDERCHMAHYTVNMLALHEATISCSNQVYFWDILNGRALSFKTAPLKTNCSDE